MMLISPLTAPMLAELFTLLEVEAAGRDSLRRRRRRRRVSKGSTP
ncbi:hypothetical protein ACFQ4J_11885 [Laceyella tengchongensis]